MDGSIKKTTREYIIYTLFLTLSMYIGTLTVNMEGYGLISAVFISSARQPISGAGRHWPAVRLRHCLNTIWPVRPSA